MKKNVPGAIKDGHVPVRTPRPVKYLLVKLGPRTRLRFPHPKGGVTIIYNDGPGFIKVDDAVVFDGEFVRVHDSTRLSIITSYQVPVLLSIRTMPRSDVTPQPRKNISLKEVLAPFDTR